MRTASVTPPAGQEARQPLVDIGELGRLGIIMIHVIAVRRIFFYITFVGIFSSITTPIFWLFQVRSYDSSDLLMRIFSTAILSLIGAAPFAPFLFLQSLQLGTSKDVIGSICQYILMLLLSVILTYFYFISF